MEQTAVEWLEKQYNSVDGYERHLTIEDFIQAKKMFEQQIIYAYEAAYMDGYYDIGKLGEQYYNEKFNK